MNIIVVTTQQLVKLVMHRFSDNFVRFDNQAKGNVGLSFKKSLLVVITLLIFSTFVTIYLSSFATADRRIKLMRLTVSLYRHNLKTIYQTLYIMSRKWCHQIHGSIVKSQRIFEILLKLERELNFQQRRPNISHHTLSI